MPHVLLQNIQGSDFCIEILGRRCCILRFLYLFGVCVGPHAPDLSSFSELDALVGLFLVGGRLFVDGKSLRVG